MGLSFRPEHLRRYLELGRLMLKYGRSDLVQQSGLADVLAGDTDAPPADPQQTATAEQLAADLERLGPTFIKLGQLASTRADLVPPAYVEALSRLQDNVEPFPYEQVEQIVTSELGVRLSKAFQAFDPVPLAAASLGQVHRATLRTGAEVVVKVQRPGIRGRIAEDMDALSELAEFFDRHTEAGRRYQAGEVLGEFRKTLLAELDYRREADNLTRLKENLQGFYRILVPAPVPDYTTSRVLTMERVRGRKITDLSPLARLELDGEALAEEIFRAYLQQILVDGFFHADPHPGNVLITDDRRLALIDVGMVGRVAPELQEQLLKLLLAVSEGHGREASEMALRIGRRLDGHDEAGFVRRVSELVTGLQGATAESIQVGRIVMEMSRGAGENGILLPPELTTLGKTLLALDQVGRTLDAAFDPNASIRRNAGEILQQRMRKQASPARLFANLLEMNELVQQLPGRVNKVFDILAANELRVRVDALDETRLIAGLQKIANRITLGLILAALILGAAMLMRVETRFRIFGYPGVAMLLFLTAVVFGLFLAFTILVTDEKRKPK